MVPVEEGAEALWMPLSLSLLGPVQEFLTTTILPGSSGTGRQPGRTLPMKPLAAVSRPALIKRQCHPFPSVANLQASPLILFFFQRPQLPQKVVALLALDSEQVRLRTSPLWAGH